MTMQHSNCRRQFPTEINHKKTEPFLSGDEMRMESGGLELEQQRFLTGWVPVVKIFNTKNRAVRLLWTLFTATMVVALISSISLVVLRYLSYITVVRLDQRGPQEGFPPPAVTLCLPEHETDKMEIPTDIYTPDILSGITRACDKDYGLHWDSKKDAVSKVYAIGGHYRLSLRAGPLGCYKMKVFEQVPYPPNSICTTFELNLVPSEKPTFWKVFAITVELTNPRRNFIGRPLIIVHEPRSFPLDNYGRYLYEYVKPGFTYNVFYSKTITKRLNTRGKPCRLNPVRLLGYEFDYDQVACQWYTICHHYRTKCGCFCPLDVIHRHQSYLNRTLSHSTSTQVPIHTCPDWCHHNHPIALVNSSTCPLACEMVAYKKLNHVEDDSKQAHVVNLVLIQAEGLTEMIEEELYSLPKLFSEIGGLSSFCFGFSCMLFFELIELAFWLRCTYRSKFAPTNGRMVTSKPATELKVRRTHKKSANKIAVQPAENHVSKAHIPLLTAPVGDSNLKNCSQIHTCIGFFTYKNSHRLPATSFDHQHSHHIALHPLKVCRVDGYRLSEYPSDQDSPILELKRHHRNKLSWIENNSISGKFSACALPPVQTFVGPHRYDVPIDVDHPPERNTQRRDS